MNKLVGVLLKLRARPRSSWLVYSGISASVIFFLVAPLLFQIVAWSKMAKNSELRSILDQLQAARPKIAEERSRKEKMIARYAKSAPDLGSFLEQTAKEQKLELSDSQPKPELPGKMYTERSTLIHIKKSGMLPIALFMEAIEKSGYPAAITKLNLRKRAAEQNAFDVELMVSVWDRRPTSVNSDVDKGKR